MRRAAMLAVLSSLLSAVPGSEAAGEEGRPARDAAPGPVAGTARLIFPQGSEYRIGVEDLLAVSVWRDPDLTREVPVRPDGRISLPLIQDVPAAGRTPEELAAAIRDRLNDVLSNPSVTVAVREVNSLKIYVLGEVASPGVLPIRSQVRLLQAIAMAGGVTPFAGRSEALIFRDRDDGAEVIAVSYRDLVNGRRASDNLILEAGDTIVVR